MSALGALVGLNLRNAYRSRIVVAVMLGFVAFFAAVIAVLVCALAIAPELRAAAPDRGRVASYLALVSYACGFVAMGMNLIIFTSNSLVKEKAQRIHETILAGPVSARELWLAKSLAVYLPGLALCEAAALGSYLALDAFLVAPAVGSVASAGALANCLFLIPALYAPLTGLVLLAGLAGNPVSGNVIANVAFSGLLTLVINLVARAGLDAGSGAFALAHLAAAAGLGVLLLALSRRLTKERIVLSARS